MHVPLLDLRAQYKSIETELKQAVNEVLESTRFIMGSKLAAFEEAMAEYTGAEHAIGVSSGTDALLVSLMALEAGPGDIVLTTPYSFFATAGTVLRVGAAPAFVDIDPESFNMCPDALAAWFDAHADKAEQVKAIIPVHLYGQCADMQSLLPMAEERDIPVIEDAAQALGAYAQLDGEDQMAGAMGALGCYSFFPSKNLGGIGDGGMVVTNDDELARTIRNLRNHGADPKYVHPMVGGNFRLDAIQAAALLVKLPHLDNWNAMRRARAAYYDAALNGTPIRTPSAVQGHERHIYNQYVIMTPERRDELRAHLTLRQIGNEVYYPVPFHLQPCMQHLGYREGDFPNSEAAAANSLAIPVYGELTEEMQAAVVDALLEFYQ